MIFERSLITLKNNHRYSYFDFYYWRQIPDGCGYDCFDCFIGKLKIGCMVQVKSGKYITSWSKGVYKTMDSALDSVARLLNNK